MINYLEENLTTQAVTRRQGTFSLWKLHSTLCLINHKWFFNPSQTWPWEGVLHKTRVYWLLPPTHTRPNVHTICYSQIFVINLINKGCWNSSWYRVWTRVVCMQGEYVYHFTILPYAKPVEFLHLDLRAQSSMSSTQNWPIAATRGHSICSDESESGLPNHESAVIPLCNPFEHKS